MALHPDPVPNVSEPIAGSPMPDIAAKAHNLEEIKQAVENAASVSGGLWISYLFLLFYIAIAAGAVTHVDLFLENSVKLPFLGLELPLRAFFFLAPIIFCVNHAYTLVHFVILSDKAKWYHTELEQQIGSDPKNPDSAASREAEDIRTRLRRQLPNNIFVQFLAGPKDIRDSWFGFLLKCIAWATLVIGPILLLLLIQMQFLPYHAQWITWANRLTLLLDLSLVWWLWHQILLGRGEFRRERTWKSYATLGSGILLSVATIVFSWALATFPGEWQEDLLSSWQPFRMEDDHNKIVSVSIHDFIFNRRINPTTRRRDTILSSTLVLPVFNIFEQLKIDDPKKAESKKYLFSARGRDLRGAVFDLSVLSKIDFEGALLQNASLDRAVLQNASFYCAHLQGASLYRAQLQGVSLFAASLQGVALQLAKADGAMFDRAQLQGAELQYAELQGASFNSANLDGATLISAKLRGATFETSRQPALPECLEKTSRRQAAVHRGADLQGAAFGKADLQGASLSGAQLQGAVLRDAMLDDTDFSHAFLWRSDLVSKDLATAHVRLADAIWTPRLGDVNEKPWDADSYAQRVQSLTTAIPAAAQRKPALIRLRALDCATTSTKLASCFPGTAIPNAVSDMRKNLEANADDGAIHQKALSAGLIDLVCSGDPDAAFIVRGLLANRRIADTGAEAPDLIDALQRPPCLMSLTDDDKAALSAAKKTAMARATK